MDKITVSMSWTNPCGKQAEVSDGGTTGVLLEKRLGVVRQ